MSWLLLRGQVVILQLEVVLVYPQEGSDIVAGDDNRGCCHEKNRAAPLITSDAAPKSIAPTLIEVGCRGAPSFLAPLVSMLVQGGCSYENQCGLLTLLPVQHRL